MRNAFSGYSFQKQVTFLLLSIMDVNRDITKIEIEAKTNDDFDDLVINIGTEIIQIQVKDFQRIKIEDIIIQNNKLILNGHKPLELSTNQNIIFFSDISIVSNEKVIGLECFRLARNVSVLSMSRVDIDQKIDDLYRLNSKRRNEIDSFLNHLFDNKIWQIPIEFLPQLKVFITELQDESILISHNLLSFNKVLFIEGKPGVGKSHFVNTLTDEFKNHVLYRFWIGNQDKDYQDRLKFNSFIRDLNTKLFNDQKIRDTTEILIKLKDEKKTFILDGLDHVENYNKADLNLFVIFINQAKDYCKIIVLSRPLILPIKWKKHILENWNFIQTRRVLNQLFHISEYSIIENVFRISQGYPIIVKYIAEHYKLHRLIPEINQIQTIDSYYQEIISNEKAKHSLSIFLCFKSFLMKSELDLMISDEKYYVEEFINKSPYLFDIKLNRISLLHDSFNAFLRNEVNYSHKVKKVNHIVSKSILNLEHRFLSRFGSFSLPKSIKKEIIIKYSSINTFEQIVHNNIDYEAIIKFYSDLRDSLVELTPNELSVINYYDLSLIFNLISRDHFFTDNAFYYTYVNSLIQNGITDEEITSSQYLFGMYFYVKTKNAILLYNINSNNHYDTRFFYKDLEDAVLREETYLKKHSKPLDKITIEKELERQDNSIEFIKYIIENIFIFDSTIEDFHLLKSSFDSYVKGRTTEAIGQLEEFFQNRNISRYPPLWIFRNSIENLQSYGISVAGENEFRLSTLKELILKNRHLGSYDLSGKIHTYIRLGLLEDRKIDIHSIFSFWFKYYQRKDYSLYSLPLALSTLENDNLISLADCIDLLKEIQDVSEKGYGHLLNEFIELYPPAKIISFLESHYHIDELEISWFKLPKKYVNRISNRTFNYQKNKVLSYHSGSSIPLEEVENVLFSNKLEKLKETLNFFKIQIRFSENHRKTVLKLRNSDLVFQEIKDERNFEISINQSQERFENGVLTFDDLDFIKKAKLKPQEIANYSDGWYTSLPQINLFHIFEPRDVSDNFKNILYNTLVRKTERINYYHALYHHPGNILKMIKLYKNEKDYRKAIKSFDKFMELSMFKLKLK